MTQPKDPPSKGNSSPTQTRAPQAPEQATPAAGSAPPAPSSAKDKRSGRVGYDARGNSVWEWQLETGVYSRDVSTQKLEKLQSDELSLMDTAVYKKPEAEGGAGERSGPKANPAGQKPKAPMPGGGFNPYDNSSAGREPLKPGPTKRDK